MSDDHGLTWLSSLLVPISLAGPYIKGSNGAPQLRRVVQGQWPCQNRRVCYLAVTQIGDRLVFFGLRLGLSLSPHVGFCCCLC
jgi:hypothetical protein